MDEDIELYEPHIYIPTPAGPEVHHQYGCVACRHFEGRGLLLLMTSPTADHHWSFTHCNYRLKQIEAALNHNGYTNVNFGAHDEALVWFSAEYKGQRLTNIAVVWENCD